MSRTELRLDALVCDLHGVVYRSGRALPGAAGALNRLSQGGIETLFCTNSALHTPDHYLRRLRSFGIKVDGPRQLLTSAMVLEEHLRQTLSAGSVALTLGGAGLNRAVAAAGLQVREQAAGVDVVVAGLAPRWDPTKVQTAIAALRAGARLVATNDDLTYPTQTGSRPDTGALLDVLQRASGVEPVVVGKPHPPMLERLAARLRGNRRIGIVGDNVRTDIAAGERMGWFTALVLTGVTSAADAATVPLRHGVVVRDLPALADLLLAAPG